MPGSRQPGPLDGHGDRVNVKDGTLNRQESPVPGRTGRGARSTGKPRKMKVLALDGAKVHELLYHAAMAEVQWMDLKADRHADPQRLVQENKALDLAAKLYIRFLAAAAQGHGPVAAFLSEQHDRTKNFLLQSQTILHGLQVENAAHAALLTEVAFGLQLVKSGATVGVAVIGCLLTGPAIVTGAMIGLGFDVIMEIVKHVGHIEEPGPKTVVIGFPQAVANDAASLAGSARQVSAVATKEALETTLSYPLKSSVYRSAGLTATRLDGLLRVLGVLGAGITIYQESGPVAGAYEEMESANRYYDSVIP